MPWLFRGSCDPCRGKQTSVNAQLPADPSISLCKTGVDDTQQQLRQADSVHIVGGVPGPVRAANQFTE